MDTEKYHELNNNQLGKVTGGYVIGDSRIVMCNECGTNFDPDTSVKGPPVEEKDPNGLGSFGMGTLYCPHCLEFHTYTVIQVKQEDTEISWS